MATTYSQLARKTEALAAENGELRQERDFLADRTNELGREIGDILFRLEILERTVRTFTSGVQH